MTLHNLKSKPKSEHGTTKSYVVGYILSLLFTIIPYYLVVNKTISGNTLLMTVLGIAFLQMIIQIFFFLHLGRGPKPFYNMVFFFATVSIIIIAIGGSLLIMSNLYHNMSPEEVTKRLAQDESISQVGGQKTGACKELKDNHIVTISGGKVSPIQTQAQLCDTLTFINEDNKKREITFGSHPNHDAYGGMYEVLVSKGRPETITLNETGDYIFHDHLDPTTVGQFSVIQ